MAMARKKEAARKKKLSSASVAAAASVAVQARVSKLQDSVDLMQLREGGAEAGARAGVWELVTARDKMVLVGVKLLDTLLSGYTVGLLVYSLVVNSALLSAEVWTF